MNALRTVPIVLLGFLAACSKTSDAHDQKPKSSASPHVAATGDPHAIEIAERVIERMGGADAWNRTRYISWKFFGERRHVWDKQSGDLRIENGKQTVLMNLNSGKGRVFDGGVEIADAAERDKQLAHARSMWINDSYWMFMPYKMLDPGVHLAYQGKDVLTEEGKPDRPADVLALTFDNVGDTPKNRYLVFVAEDTGLVEKWCYFEDSADAKPKMETPWKDWKRIGAIELCMSHGDGKDWDIAVYADLPRAVFESPQPVELPKKS